MGSRTSEHSRVAMITGAVEVSMEGPIISDR